jgi:hypothetical protein
MMQLEFNLPCKHYVGHYLKTQFGNPIHLTNRTDIGRYFFSLVEDASFNREKEIVKGYKHEVVVLITESVFLKKGCVLTKTGIQDFNNYVEDSFKKQVNTMLDTLVEINDVKIKHAIDFVYDKFDMDETILPLETIVKQYYRNRKARKALSLNE